MTLTQLKYIIAVDTHKSFARAARDCLVAQPTLSLQIQKLEQELGNELFDRKKNPVTTTAFGREVIDQARVIIRETEKLEHLAASPDGVLKGEISIGIIPTISTYLVPLIYAKLSNSYPQVVFRFFELPTSSIIKRLEAETLEIGILATPLHIKNIVEIPLYYEPFVAYFPPGHKGSRKNLDINKLDASDLILLSEEHCFRHQALKLCGKSNPGKIECGSVETIRKVVDLGQGMTLLPLLSIDANEPQVGRFRSPEPVREISLTYRKGFYKKQILKAVEEAILKEVPSALLKKENKRVIGVELGEDRPINV